MPEEQEKKPQTKVGVAVLVKNGDRILLVKRANSHGAGSWAPPGGHFQFGESIEHCAQRETKEETNVDIDNTKFRVITNDLFEAEQKHYITVWVEANYVSGDARVAAPEEADDIGWFNWNNLPQPLFIPLQNLLEGKTYPSQTTTDKVGDAIESPHPLQY